LQTVSCSGLGFFAAADAAGCCSGSPGGAAADDAEARDAEAEDAEAGQCSGGFGEP
jgi:hypothetical protein